MHLPSIVDSGCMVCSQWYDSSKETADQYLQRTRNWSDKTWDSTKETAEQFLERTERAAGRTYDSAKETAADYLQRTQDAAWHCEHPFAALPLCHIVVSVTGCAVNANRCMVTYSANKHCCSHLCQCRL